MPGKKKANHLEDTANVYIIRKTKRSEKIKRSVISRKTKHSFFRFPPHNARRLRFLWGVSRFLYISDIQLKLHTLITIEQQLCTLYIILVQVYISEVQRYVLQRQVYLPCH